MLKQNYPFDPKIKHHIIIGLLLAVWVFVFLYFTEPLDVNEFDNSEKLIYLPLYGLLACLLYYVCLPFQSWLYNKHYNQWFIFSELILFVVFCIIAIAVLRLFYLHVVMDWHPNAYSFSYHLKSILFPALLTVLPIILIGRFAFGRYHEKQLEDQKIEIKGEGNFEGIRLHLNDVVNIQSSDNYIEVVYISGNELKKALIRNKLSVIDDEFSELIRTHRSYLVNPFHFQQWKTEKGKHFLVLSYHIEIPISKTYLENVKTLFQSTTKQ